MASGLGDPSFSGVGTGGMTAQNDGRNSAQQLSEKGFGTFRKQTLRKIMNDKLYGDLHAMRTDPAKLGFSEAEQQQMTDQAAQGATMQRAASQREIGRQALAGQGFQQGAFADTSRQIAGDAAQDMAAASANVQDLNEQKIQAEKQRITQEVNQERERRKANNQFWMKFGLDGLTTIGQLIMPIP